MDKNIIQKGALNIIQNSLDLHPGQDLLIIFDETTKDVAEVLSKTAIELRVQPTMLYIPQSVQKLIPTQMELSPLTQRIFQQVRAVVNCINGLAEFIPFRDHLLKVNRNAHTRIGHMPGISLDVLRLAAVDYTALIHNCKAIAMALTYGRNLELTSFQANGTSHTLNIPIGGLERIAVASDGIISDGVWGNVPSGEAYIAPIEGLAFGSIVINGSLPGLIISADSELILSFEAGHVSKIEYGNSVAADWLQETQIKPAIEAGDVEWSNLAEIGIGVNPGYDQLTGNMLLDEKLLQTAHIALGSNMFMGGQTNSIIHCDLVTLKPTITIDGLRILDHGQLVFNEAEWRQSYKDLDLSDSPLKDANHVCRSGVPVLIDMGRLQRCNFSEPGKMFPSFVGDNETAQLANTLYQALPVEGSRYNLTSLAGLGGLTLSQIRKVLHVMWLHEIIRIDS